MDKIGKITKAGEFVIIDNWNHQYVETLPREQAIEKYGECEAYCGYTSGESLLPDGEGKTPSWRVDVWLDIPGMQIGYWNGPNLHLLFVGDNKEATFIGKKSGQLITVHRWGVDDYSVWWRDVVDRDYDFAGFSIRGTAEEIIRELKGEIGNE